MIALAVLLVGCSRTNESYEQRVHELEHLRFQLNELDYQHNQLQESQTILQIENEVLREIISDLEDSITITTQELDTQAQEDESEEDTTQPEDTPVFQGLTAPQIRQNLIQNSHIILEALGGDEIIIHEDDILVGTGSALARVGIPVRDWPVDIDVILLYHTAGDDIVWQLFAYTMVHTGMQTAAPIPEEEQPLPTYDDTITLRFFQYSDWDDYTVVYENISRENWRAQTISLMQQHTGIGIRDIRYDGTRLYVDIFPIDIIPFNWGSTGGAIRTQTLVNSMASLPGVDEIVILVGGVGGHWADHFDFSSAFYVR